jgi:hypothetical protein
MLVAKVNKCPTKNKIKSNGKSYAFKDSPLYNISTKGKLAKLLNIDLSKINKLKNDDNYYVFFIETKGKKRIIETPNDALNLVHTRLSSLLSRIAIPEYVYSGVKGKSHIMNAKEHRGAVPVLIMDIKNFYPSVTKKSLYYFFHKTMKAATDVAGILAELCTYKDHLPTGSRISMPLAFWANYRMYTKLEMLCNKRKVKMSVYVDDLTFSGKLVNKGLMNDIKRIISDSGLIVHPNKTKLYKAHQPKLITGVIIKKDKVHVRNAHHKKIYELFTERRNSLNNKDLSEKHRKELIGALAAAGQIDSTFKSKAKQITKK